MNAELLTALRALSAPGAVLVIRNYPCFDHASMVIETPNQPDGDIVMRTVLALRELEYIERLEYIPNPQKWTYTITPAGRAALAAAEETKAREG